MKFKVKKNFYIGMRRYKEGEVYDFDASCKERLSEYIEPATTPIPVDGEMSNTFPSSVNTEAETKHYEKPPKDKLIKKSKKK